MLVDGVTIFVSTAMHTELSREAYCRVLQAPITRSSVGASAHIPTFP